MADSTSGRPVNLGIEGQSGTGGGYSPDAQNLGRAPSDGSGQAHESYQKAKRSVADSYAQARQAITDLGGQAQRAASDWTQQTRAETEAYVRKQPWKALGIAAGIAFLVALMLRR